MATLPRNPTLLDYQRYVTEIEHERGFAGQSLRDKCLLMGEEVGELFKAVRKREKLAIDAESKVGAIGEELVDVFIYLCAVANRCDVDLERAFLEKEAKNKTRTWA